MTEPLRQDIYRDIRHVTELERSLYSWHELDERAVSLARWVFEPDSQRAGREL